MSKREIAADELAQMPWVPPTSEDQLTLGIKLVNYAYMSRYTGLEREVASLAGRVKELSSQLREAEDRAAESELVLQELRSKNCQLAEDNDKMTTALRKLKVENSRLQSLTNNIRSTIDANNSQMLSDISGPLTPTAKPQLNAQTVPAAPNNE